MNQNRLEIINNLIIKTKSPAYRMEQVKHALFKEYIKKYSEMTSLPENLRTSIVSALGDDILTLKKIGEAKSKQTHKILFETRDGNRIETVRMLLKSHTLLCISSQSGCGLGCKFCATGEIGFKKNLTADEIADQVLYFKQNGADIDTISFMGMGEPFANPNLWDALNILTDKDKMGISRKKISISTIGIIPGIEKLTSDYPQINLAFSLHTPFDDQRIELMPVAKAYPTEKVMQSIGKYIDKTNNKVFIAYALMDGVNDSPQHAKALTKLIQAQGKKAYLYHVNLIRYNPGPIPKYKKPKKEAINKFMRTLKEEKLNATLRQSFGTEIYAACGQLYGSHN